MSHLEIFLLYTTKSSNIVGKYWLNGHNNVSSMLYNTYPLYTSDAIAEFITDLYISSETTIIKKYRLLPNFHSLTIAICVVINVYYKSQ